jgi:hypothetical protein
MITLLEVLLIGLLVAAVIAAQFFIRRAKERQRAWLLPHGKKIMATIIRIEEHITRNRYGFITARSYQVLALWDDPQTRQVYEFTRRLESPLGYQERLPVPVWIDPNNPRRYWMGIPEVTKDSTWFQQHGKTIMATILTVKEQAAGVSPLAGHYIVTALWDDPQTREVYEFLKLVDDPEAYHPRHSVPVLIDPDNPHHYEVGKPEAM